ncbi:TonB-dependent siderophore receptor [Alteraurantiacibacter aquimixticola]|uniref:TonB-dependent siderophore receptor n=1 Tax=Alteraurantiacibacter aquimixticola TaxID=2489173 RepID=A0A4V4U9R2_9SPHN|nr:TonB-dependent siderophore receptor [Alteraurantiacibacter aquimixticola]TIX52137.1 TonB-dependent siderophore receptor [Alteraurantiacibacter aquimixticola]
MLLASVATPAMAQGSASSGQKEDENEIVVTATGLSAAVSTTKTESPIIESPQSISIISREEMDLRAASTIADALSYSAGVQAEPSGIDSRTDEVSVRGFGAGGFSSNNNFVDGLRLPTGGQWTRFGFDPFGLEQIEVLKGPSSVLYGQAAPGGMVNIVSKRPTPFTQGEILVQGQSYTDLGNWSGRIAGDIAGSLNDSGTVSGRIVGLAHSGGTQVDDVDNSRYYVSPSVTWSPGTDTQWTLLAQYQRDEGGSTFQFLPSTGSYQPTNGRFIANDANIGEPDWNRFDRNQFLIASLFEHNFSDALTLRNNMRYTHVDTLFRVTVLSGDTITDCSATSFGSECIDGQTIGRRAVQGDGESDGFAVDTQLEGRFKTGALSHTVLAGIDYFDTEWEHLRDLVNQPGAPGGQVLPLWDIFNPVPRGSDDYLDNLTPQIYGSAKSEQTGLYLQDQIGLGGLRLTIGGRYDWANDESVNLLTDASFATEAKDFTWRAGAVYLFDNGLAPYVSYSESFLPQVVDPSQTLDGILFVPTTGEQFEAGIRYQSGRNIYLTAGVFEITQQNVATSDPNGTLCGRRVCQVQAGEARVRGVEIEGRASLASGTTFIASFSHLDAKITESNDPIVGNKMQAVPEILASLFVDQRIESGPLAGLGFGAGVRYTGESFGDTNNLFPIDDYTLFDLLLRYDFGAANPAMDGVALSINARNIANKRYVVTCGTVASCYYGQGRVVTARLQYKW